MTPQSGTCPEVERLTLCNDSDVFRGLSFFVLPFVFRLSKTNTSVTK